MAGKLSSPLPAGKLEVEVVLLEEGRRVAVGSSKLQVSFGKEPYKTDYILQKRPINRASRRLYGEEGHASY